MYSWFGSRSGKEQKVSVAESSNGDECDVKRENRLPSSFKEPTDLNDDDDENSLGGSIQGVEVDSDQSLPDEEQQEDMDAMGLVAIKESGTKEEDMLDFELFTKPKSEDSCLPTATRTTTLEGAETETNPSVLKKDEAYSVEVESKHLVPMSESSDAALRPENTTSSANILDSEIKQPTKNDSGNEEEVRVDSDVLSAQKTLDVPASPVVQDSLAEKNIPTATTGTTFEGQTHPEDDKGEKDTRLAEKEEHEMAEKEMKDIRMMAVSEDKGNSNAGDDSNDDESAQEGRREKQDTKSTDGTQGPLLVIDRNLESGGEMELQLESRDRLKEKTVTNTSSSLPSSSPQAGRIDSFDNLLDGTETDSASQMDTIRNLFGSQDEKPTELKEKSNLDQILEHSEPQFDELLPEQSTQFPLVSPSKKGKSMERSPRLDIKSLLAVAAAADGGGGGDDDKDQKALSSTAPGIAHAIPKLESIDRFVGEEETKQGEKAAVDNGEPTVPSSKVKRAQKESAKDKAPAPRSSWSFFGFLGSRDESKTDDKATVEDLSPVAEAVGGTSLLETIDRLDTKQKEEREAELQKADIGINDDGDVQVDDAHAVDTFLVDDAIIAKTLSIYEQMSEEEELLLESFRKSEPKVQETNDEDTAEAANPALVQLRKSRAGPVKQISNESQALFDILDREFASVTPRVKISIPALGVRKQLNARDVKLCFMAFVKCFSPPPKSHFAVEYNHNLDEIRSRGDDETRSISSYRSDSDGLHESKVSSRPFVPTRIVSALWIDVIKCILLEELGPGKAGGTRLEAFGHDVFAESIAFLRDTLVLLGVLDIRKVSNRPKLEDPDGEEKVLSMTDNLLLAIRDSDETPDEVISVHQQIHQDYGEYSATYSGEDGMLEFLEMHETRWNKLISEGCSPNTHNSSEATYVVQMLPWNLIRAQKFKSAAELLADKKFIYGRLQALGTVGGTTAHASDVEELLLRYLERKGSILCFDVIDIDRTMLDCYDKTRRLIVRQVDEATETDDEGEFTDRQLHIQAECGKAVHLLGVSLGAQGHVREEMECLQQALGWKAACSRDGTPTISMSDTLHCIGFSLDNAGKYQEAMQYYDEAIQIRRELLGENDLRLAETLHNKGAILCENGACDEAFQFLQEALRIREANYGQYHETCADTQQWIGNVMREWGQYDDALTCFKMALQTKKSILGKDHEEVANTLQNMAVVLDDMGKFQLSMECYNEAMRIYTSHSGRESGRVADTLQRMAIDYTLMDDKASALEKFRETIAIREKLLSGDTKGMDDHTEVARSLIFLRNSGVEIVQDLLCDLVECYEESIELINELEGSDNADMSNTLHRLGGLYWQMQYFEDSEERLQGALKVQRNLAKKGRFDEEEVCKLLHKKGIVHLCKKDLQKAKSCFESVVYRRRRSATKDTASEASSLYGLGVTFSKLGAHKLSWTCFIEALRLWTSVYGESDVKCGYSLYWIGTEEFRMGNQEKALTHYKGALQSFKANKKVVDYAIVVKTLEFLGEIHENLNDLDSAMKCYDEGIRLVHWKFGESHVFCIGMLCRSGAISETNGDTDSAQQFYIDAISVMKECCRLNDVQLCETTERLGLLLEAKEDLEAAKDALSEAYRLYEATIGQDDIQTAGAVLKLGRVLDKLDSTEAAMQCFRESLRVQRLLAKPDHPELAETLSCMGANLAITGKFDEAIKCFQQALSIQRSLYGDSDGIVADTIHKLGKAYKEIGGFDKTVVCFKEALRIRRAEKEENHNAEIAEISFGMGEAHEGNNNFQAAIAHYEEALRIWHEEEGEHMESRIAFVLCKLGEVQSKANDDVKGIDFFMEALSLLDEEDNDDDEDGGENVAFELKAHVLSGLAKSHANTGSFDAAIAFYQQHFDFLQTDASCHGLASDSLYAMGTIYARLDNYNDAIDHFKECLLVRKKCFGGTDERVARVLVNMGIVFEKSSNYAAAKDCFEEALRINKANGNEKEAAGNLQDRGRALAKQGDLDGALISYAESLQLFKKILGPNDVQVASLLQICGNALYEKHEPDKALDVFRDALRVRKATAGRDRKEVGEIMFMMGRCLEDKGNSKEAIETLTNAASVLKKVVGVDSIEVGNCLHYLGVSHRSTGEYYTAVSNLLEALPARKRHFGDEALEVAETNFELATCFAKLKKLTDAIEHSVKALKIRKLVLGNASLFCAESLQQLGDAQAELEKYSEALNCHVEALKVYGAINGKDHISVAESLEKIGDAYLGMDHLDNAMENFKRAAKLFTENLGGVSNQVARVFLAIGRVEVRKGNNDIAIGHFKQSIDISKEVGNDEAVASGLYEIGGVLEARGSRGEALECYRESLRLASEERSPLVRARTHARMGDISLDLAEFDDAVSMYEKSLSIYKRINGEDSVEVGETMISIASVCEARDSHEQAGGLFKKAYDLLSKKLGPVDLKVASTLNNLAINSARLKKFDDAIELSEECLRIRKEKLGLEHIDTCDALYNFASILDESGKFEDAMKYYTQAMESYRLVLGDGTIEVANCFQYVGVLHLRRGEDDLALRALVEALRIFEHEGEHGSNTATVLYQLGRVYTKKRDPEKALEALAQSLRLHKENSSDPNEVAQTCDEIGRAYFSKRMMKEAKKFFQKAIKIYKEQGKDGTLDFARAMEHMGSTLSKEEAFDKAIDYFNTAMDIFARDLGDESDEVANILTKIGVIHNKRVDYEEALQFLTRALKIRTKLFGRDDLRVADNLFEIAKVMEEWGDSDEAIDTFEEVIRIMKAVSGPRHLRIAEALRRIGMIKLEKGQSEEALDAIDDAIDIQKRLLGGDAAEVGHTLISAAAAFDAQGEEDKALASYSEALRIFKLNYGDEDVSVALALNNIGINHARRKNFSKALSLCSEALRIRKSRLGDTHLDIADSCLNIANVLDDWGRDDQALQFYNESLDLYRSQLGDDDVEVANCYQQIGGVYTKQNQLDLAVTCYVEAIRIFRLKKGQDSPEVGNSLYNLGRAYAKTAAYDKALACFKECLRIRVATQGEAHADVHAVHRYIEAIERKRRR